MSTVSEALKKIKLADVLEALDPAIVEQAKNAPEFARDAIYAAIDRIPAKWGTLGKFLFRLVLRDSLRRQADKWIRETAAAMEGVR
jgi:hypothetical protein